LTRHWAVALSLRIFATPLFFISCFQA
jgi:hypothetical protein